MEEDGGTPVIHGEQRAARNIAKALSVYVAYLVPSGHACVGILGANTVWQYSPMHSLDDSLQSLQPTPSPPHHRTMGQYLPEN